jgi:hypothetical protein
MSILQKAEIGSNKLSLKHTSPKRTIDLSEECYSSDGLSIVRALKR